MARAPSPTKLDPEGMLVFAALSRAGGVRAAAASLGMPRSTISRRLSELEDQAGVPLVVRTARRFALTEAGSVLAERCAELEGMLARAHEAVHSSARDPSGTLRVAAAPVLGEAVLPELVATLLQRWPALSVHVSTTVDYVDLRGGGVDVALRAWSIEDASDLYAVRLGTSTTGYWASADYLRTRGTPHRPEDLATHECIVVGGGAKVVWNLHSDRRHEGVPVTGRLRVDTFRLARDLAARGAGILRAAPLLVDPLVASGELVPILERHWRKTPIFAVHAGPNPPSPKVRAFIELARPAVARVLRG